MNSIVWNVQGNMYTLREALRMCMIHESMNRPKIEIIAYIYILL